jgi:LuxR family maltose regulon positive regulatory protein
VTASAPIRLDARRRRPRLRQGLVDRERLVRRLTEADDAQLVLLVAPVGYGKSTLLAQWAQADARPFAWLTLHERDNDAAHLLGSIIEQLDEIEPLPPEVRDAPSTARAATMLPRLARALESRRRPSVLVLDDVHVLRSPTSLETVGTIAEHMGAGSVLALASRTALALPIGRLRAEDGVVELGTHDLAMLESEAMSLLRAAGLELRPDEALQILRRAEGWPAALRLAVRALREQAQDGAASVRFAGDDRLVAEYVRDELLSQLNADQLAFLMRTAPLERLSGPLCEAVLGRPGCGRVLRDLARSNLLLVPLDRAEGQFRHHTLLAEMLRAELARLEPLRCAETHLRASAWHEQQGDDRRAIDEAIASGNADRGGELLWRIAPAYASSGRSAAIERWLARFRDDQILARPTLALTAATNRLIRGDRDDVERFATAAAHALAQTSASRPRAVLAAVATMRAAVAREGTARMRIDASQAYACTAEDGPWRPYACLLEGVARHLTGDRAHARARLEEGVRRGRLAAPAVQALCLAQLALLAFEEEDWARATTLVEQAQRTRHRGLDDDPACTLVAAAAAAVHAHCGSAEAARRELADAHRLLAMLTGAIPWYDALVRIALARTELRLSNAAKARALLAEASRMLRQVPDAVVLRSWIDDAWARADAFAVSSVRGPSALTTAELRVLRLLPSHFSFREIAARLHVSANTIKTQAHAVYRKLDVSSRSEAVARAREVGLVDGY